MLIVYDNVARRRTRRHAPADARRRIRLIDRSVGRRHRVHGVIMSAIMEIAARTRRISTAQKKAPPKRCRVVENVEPKLNRLL